MIHVPVRDDHAAEPTVVRPHLWPGQLPKERQSSPIIARGLKRPAKVEDQTEPIVLDFDAAAADLPGTTMDTGTHQEHAESCTAIENPWARSLSCDAGARREFGNRRRGLDGHA
jgi:hypothetical protein